MIVFILPLLFCFLLGYIIGKRKKLTDKMATADVAVDAPMPKPSKKLGLLFGFLKVFFWITYILLIIKVILIPVIKEYGYGPLGPIHTDVAKRISSPDYTKTALLIRRFAFDLNFAVKIKKGPLTKTLHWTRDFYPDDWVNWNEELVWSYDSSFLVMSVDNPFDDEEKYMWAYDFKDDNEYADETLILEILNSRNEGKENPVEVLYQ